MVDLTNSVSLKLISRIRKKPTGNILGAAIKLLTTHSSKKEVCHRRSNATELKVIVNGEMLMNIGR